METEPAIHTAAKQNDLAWLQTLIKSGVDLNEAGPQGETALHLAAWRGHLAFAKVLIGAGAEINAESCELGTPLHWAAWRGDYDFCRWLLDNGADPSAMDEAGEKPQQNATRGQHDAVARLITNYRLRKNMNDCLGRMAWALGNSPPPSAQ